jgi:hypothetical protein
MLPKVLDYLSVISSASAQLQSMDNTFVPLFVKNRQYHKRMAGDKTIE